MSFWEAMGEWMLGGPWPMEQIDWIDEVSE